MPGLRTRCRYRRPATSVCTGFSGITVTATSITSVICAGMKSSALAVRSAAISDATISTHAVRKPDTAASGRHHLAHGTRLHKRRQQSQRNHRRPLLQAGKST